MLSKVGHLRDALRQTEVRKQVGSCRRVNLLISVHLDLGQHNLAVPVSDFLQNEAFNSTDHLVNRPAENCCQRVLGEEILGHAEERLNFGHLDLRVIECALGLGVELVVAAQVPPARIVIVVRSEFIENERWVCQLVQTERRNCQLARLDKCVPVVFKAVGTFHREEGESLASVLFNDVPVTDFEPEFEGGFRHPIVHHRCVEH